MRLCIVTHRVVLGDGQGRVNYEVAWEAIRRGHHVTLVASSVAPELQQNSQVNWIDIPVKGYPTQLLSQMVFSMQSGLWLHKHQREFDLIKVNGAITWARGDVNAVHFVHSSWLRFSYGNARRSVANPPQQRRSLRSTYQWFYTALNARWEKKAFDQAKVVVAVSEKVAKELIEIGVPPECIRVILNGVDLQEFAPGAVDHQKWGLPENVPLALFAGDIRTPRKNLDTILNALVQVPELHLIVVGATAGSPYPQLAESLKLEERVHFVGFREDVPDLMKAADFLVFPSRYEPFGLVVLEAMATGLPVVTAATTGAAELVTPECGVVLPDSDDTPALAEAMSRLAKCDRQQKSQMGEAARAIAEQHSWANMASSYVDLFEELNQC